MDVQLFTQFYFCYAASLTSVIVSTAYHSALLSPVRAIVWSVTAFPVEVIFACFPFSIVNRHASSGASNSLVEMAGLNGKFTLADGTNFGRQRGQITGAAILFAKLRIVRARGSMFFHPVTKAFARAKATAGRFGGGGEFFVALFTSRLVSRRFPVTNVRRGVLGGTCPGTVFSATRVGLVVDKFFAAFWALSCRFRVRMIKAIAALYRTSLDRPTVVECEFLAANRTRFSYVVFWFARSARTAFQGAVGLGFSLADKLLSACRANDCCLIV